MHDHSPARCASARPAAGDEARKQSGQLGALVSSESVERSLHRRAALTASLLEHGATSLGEGDDAAAGVGRVSRARYEPTLDTVRDDATCSRLVDPNRGGEFVHTRSVTQAVKRRQQAIARHVREGMLVPTPLPAERSA